MTISLVTGGAGFIGSHLVRALILKGDHVKVLDNFSTGKEENLAEIINQIDVHEGDLRNVVQVKEAVRGVDYIFHQAAEVSPLRSIEDPQTCYDINVQGTLNILSAAQKESVKKVVLASSCAVYGDSQSLPLKENVSTRSLSPYAASKAVNEVHAGLYTRTFNLPVLALRYFNVYGPRQSCDSDYAAAIPIFTHTIMKNQSPTIYGDGYQSRDFIFIEDVVRANLMAAESPPGRECVVNVCSGKEITILELLSTIKDVLSISVDNKFAPPRPGDIYRSLGDPSLAHELLGFRTQIDLADGLLKTIDWIRS